MKRMHFIGCFILLIALVLSGCTKTIKNSDGSIYIGDAGLFSSTPNGNGIMTFTNHHRTEGHVIKECIRYDGQWNNGYMDGVGTVSWDDGVIYQGSIKNNEFDGQGKMYTGEGNILYTGGFKSGLKEGDGVTTLYTTKKTGGKDTFEVFQIFEGTYVKDTLNGDGKIFNKDNQLIYDGQLKEDQRDGVGKAYYPNGTLAYEGLFSEGGITGLGNFYDESGNELDVRDEQSGKLWAVTLEDKYGEERGSLSSDFNFELYRSVHSDRSQAD